MSKAVYNPTYYRTQKLLNDPSFQRKIQWLKDRFVYFGIPVPNEGFQEYTEYTEWNKKFWEVWSNKDLAQKKKEKYQEFEDFEKELYPPLYGAIFREILREHDFDERDKKLRQFLTLHVFFNHKEYTEPAFTISHKRNPKTNEFEMFVRICPWTKRDDIASDWDFIEQSQQKLPGYVGKNKAWKNFERDIEIYEAHKEADRLKENGDNRTVEAITSELLLKKDYKKYTAMDLDHQNIKKIVQGAKRRLGEEG